MHVQTGDDKENTGSAGGSPNALVLLSEIFCSVSIWLTWTNLTVHRGEAGWRLKEEGGQGQGAEQIPG